MLNVTFTDTGKILSLRLEGHAGYAEIGKDLVCASASILAYTVAQFILEAEDKGDIVTSQVRLDVGDTVVSCQPQEDAYAEIKQMYRFAMTGYALLAHNHPQYVRLMP